MKSRESREKALKQGENQQQTQPTYDTGLKLNQCALTTVCAILAPCSQNWFQIKLQIDCLWTQFNIYFI